MRTRVLIGLMGGDTQAAEARDIGVSIARLGHVLLTGAPIGEPSSQRVHRAAMHAASLTGTARLIGILPRGGEADPDIGAPARSPADTIGTRNRFFAPIRDARGFYFHTGMDNEERDSITGMTPDVLIFFQGSAGTLCELAYAAAAGRKTYFVDCAEFLRGKLRAPERAGKIDRTLAKAQRLCPTINGRSVSLSDLKHVVTERLATAEDWKGTLATLAAEAVEAVSAEGLGPETGFPIFMGEEVKREFERRVLELG